MPNIIDVPEVDLSPSLTTAEFTAPVVAEVRKEVGTGKVFDFTIHEDLMDPVTRQLYFLLRYAAQQGDINDHPNGRKMYESEIVRIIGPKHGLAAALNVSEEDIAKMREAEKKQSSDAAAKGATGDIVVKPAVVVKR